MSRLRRPALWQVYLAVAVATMVVYQVWLSSEPQSYAYAVFTVVASAVLFAGVLMNRPRRPWPYVLFGAGLAWTAVADVIYMTYEVSGAVPYPSLADAFYLLAYPFWAAGIGLLVYGQGRSRDWARWIDAAIGMGTFGLVAYVLWMHPYATDVAEPWMSRAVSVAYPAGDILVIGALAGLVLSSTSRVMSFRLMALGFMSLLMADIFYGGLALYGEYDGGIIDLAWMAAYALLAGSMLHPSMRKLAEAGPDQARGLTRGRLVGLAMLAVVAPGLFVYTGLVAHLEDESLGVGLIVAVSAGAALLFLLVVARMAGLVRELSWSMQALERAEAGRRSLLRRTLYATEDERSAVASALHDGPVQRLTGLSYQLASLRNHAASGKAIRQEEMKVLEKELSGEVNALREIMTHLRPGSFEERGLEAGLADYVSSITADKAIECSIELEVADRPRPEVEINLYRVAQEAINNAVQHSGARRLDVSLQQDERSLVLRVADDGDGFDSRYAAHPDRALGLASMRERVEMAGGLLSIESMPGRGTVVEARVPWRTRDSASRLAG